MSDSKKHSCWIPLKGGEFLKWLNVQRDLILQLVKGDPRFDSSPAIGDSFVLFLPTSKEKIEAMKQGGGVADDSRLWMSGDKWLLCVEDSVVIPLVAVDKRSVIGVKITGVPESGALAVQQYYINHETDNELWFGCIFNEGVGDPKDTEAFSEMWDEYWLFNKQSMGLLTNFVWEDLLEKCFNIKDLTPPTVDGVPISNNLAC